MKSVRSVMTTDIVWISPTARVKTAVILMKGHNVSALPVVNTGDEVVGLVTCLNLLGEPDDLAIIDVMEREFVSCTPEAKLTDVLDDLRQYDRHHVVVVEDDKLVGMLSHTQITPELGKTYDPLTEMPWSDSFREWSAEALKQGKEISVIFFDLDDFGSVNKRYDHLVGDKILKEIAYVIKKTLNSDTDFACRYGGDEFALVSTRSAPESLEFAETISTKISHIIIDGVDEKITATYGISGGRRTRERDAIHYEATIDDLITRASKECNRKKSRRSFEDGLLDDGNGGAPQIAARSQGVSYSTSIVMPRFKIHGISYSTTDNTAEVRVSLVFGSKQFDRTLSGCMSGSRNLMRMIAEGTAGCVCSSLPSGHGIVVEDVFSQDSEDSDEIITVVAVYVTPAKTLRLVGSALVHNGNSLRAAAAALLDAVNRQLDHRRDIFSQEEDPDPSIYDDTDDMKNHI